MYNQILLGPDCLCSRLLLGCKKCAPKVICSFSARCLWRAEYCKIHFSVDTLTIFSLSLPLSLFLPSLSPPFSLVCVFPFTLEMELGDSERGTKYSFHSVTYSAVKSGDATAHYTRLNLCRCIQWFHRNIRSFSFFFPFSQIIWKQRSLQCLWPVHSSQ